MHLPLKKSHLIGLLAALIVLVLLAYLISRLDIDWDRDGFTKAQGDCDNWDAAEFPGQNWYADCDGDNFYRTSAVMACDLASAATPCTDMAPPDGGWSHTYTRDLADCDDEDPNEFPGQIWYADCDGDTFMGATAVTACALTKVASPCADHLAPDGGWTNTNPGSSADRDDEDSSKHN